MIKIYPAPDVHPITYIPIPDTTDILKEILWQGVHICGVANTSTQEKILFDLPVGEGSIRPAAYNMAKNEVYSYFQSDFNWYTEIFKEIAQTPDNKDITLEIIKRSTQSFKKIIILNTIDAWYGHSIIFLFHLQRLIEKKDEETGIVVLIQPFAEWLVPANGIAEIWKAGMKLSEAKKFYPSLSRKINAQLPRFEEVYLSEAPVLADNFNISFFTQIPIFREERFGKPGNRITFIWREDPNRLWMNSYYIYGGLKLLKLQKILLPLQWLRVRLLFGKLRRVWGSEVVFTITGLGSYGKFPIWVKDERVNAFDDITERMHCRIYAESELVVGLHGSSMILPSAHAGMCISMMPQKRWGNFAEDIIFQGEKTFKCLFRKRVVPLNMPLNELRDVCISMKDGVVAFNEKVKGTYSEIL